MQSASIPQTADLTLVTRDEGSSFVLCKSNRRRQRDRQAQECLLFISFSSCYVLWKVVDKREEEGEQGL
jgi:hypothetical protein